MSKKYVIVNRASKTRDGWIHIVPKGELPNAEAGIVQVLDDASLDSIFNRLQAEHAPAEAAGLYMGREHFIYDDTQDSEALGWGKIFNRDAEGIWVNANGLTDIGQEAVKNRRYKYTSFVADPKDLQKLDGNRHRVMAIETVGFTNLANGKELLAPITNRATNTFADSRESAANQENQTKGNKMKTVLAELGLDADASEQSALAATIKLKNRLAALEPLEGEITKLKKQVTQLDGANVDALLVQHGITDEKVKNRMRPLIAKIETPEERSQFLEDCNFKPVEAAKSGGNQVKLFNRDTTPPIKAGPGNEAAASKEDKDLAGKIMNRAREMMTETKNLSLATAVTMAQRELQPAA